MWTAHLNLNEIKCMYLQSSRQNKSMRLKNQHCSKVSKQLLHRFERKVLRLACMQSI